MRSAGAAPAATTLRGMQSFRTAYTRTPWIAFVVDAVLVIVFAVLGRAAHAESLYPLGVAGTAAPFLGALLLGWAIVRLTRMAPAAPWPSGAVIWLVTVSSGLALRILLGATAALPFIGVTAGVLLVLLLLPRIVGFSRAALREAGEQGA